MSTVLGGAGDNAGMGTGVGFALELDFFTSVLQFGAGLAKAFWKAVTLAVT